jgi:hypothetical protein
VILTANYRNPKARTGRRDDRNADVQS